MNAFIAVVGILTALPLGGAGVAPVADTACTSANHRAFDFWIGEWEVRYADGTLAGLNSIRRGAGGCLVTESWRGASGSRGESMNYVDADGRWRQRWVDDSGLVLSLTGGPWQGGMRLEGSAGDTAVAHRITWTPEPGGRVRQVWETSEGRGWTVVFDGLYTRLPSPESLDVGASACDVPQGRAFSFWPGEWLVDSRLRAADGTWHESTGVWFAESALGGCAFVDRATGPYGPGPIAGLGTRFFDPRSETWTITWVSTAAPGRQGVWTGRFDSPTEGSFYSDPRLNDGRQSRIRWQDVTADSASWDYSVSTDAGATWTVVWTMRFRRLGR